MSGDGEIQKKLRTEITTETSLSWLALFLCISQMHFPFSYFCTFAKLLVYTSTRTVLVLYIPVRSTGTRTPYPAQYRTQ